MAQLAAKESQRCSMLFPLVARGRSAIVSLRFLCRSSSLQVHNVDRE